VPCRNKTLIPQMFSLIFVTINTCRHIHKVVKIDCTLHCVCLPVSPYGTTWLPVDRFHEILFSGFLLKSVEKIQFWLHLDKIKRHFTWKHIFVTDFVSNITKVTDVSVVAIFTSVLWLLWWMLPLIYLSPWLLWLPRLVLFISFAIIFIRVTKQHILES
jgi:hypothetical protein